MNHDQNPSNCSPQRHFRRVIAAALPCRPARRLKGARNPGVSVDTQRLETGPVKCNSITKNVNPRVPRPRWTGVRAPLPFYLGSFACAACAYLMEYIALQLANQSRPQSGRPVQVAIRGWQIQFAIQPAIRMAFAIRFDIWMAIRVTGELIRHMHPDGACTWGPARPSGWPGHPGWRSFASSPIFPSRMTELFLITRMAIPDDEHLTRPDDENFARPPALRHDDNF